jgi:hypothetical protein
MFTAAAGIATKATATAIFVMALRTPDGVVQVIDHSLREPRLGLILPLG